MPLDHRMIPECAGPSVHVFLGGELIAAFQIRQLLEKMFHFLGKICHLKSSNQDFIHLTLSKTKLRDLKHDEFFEEDSFLSFRTADLSPPSSRWNLFKLRKSSQRSSFPKNRRKHLGHLCFCFADGYLNTVCCYIKIWNPKKNLTKFEQKHRGCACQRRVEEKELLRWGFQQRREFPGMVLYLDVPEG